MPVIIGFLLMAHYVRTYIDWSLRKTLAVAVPVFLIGYAFSVGAFYHLSSVSSDPFVVEQLGVFVRLMWR